jgi:polyisoprenoid-binding protein YceI
VRAACIGLALAFAASASAQDRLYVVDPALSQIRFHAVSRLMNADGAFHRFGGEIRLEPARPETATARVTIDIASIDTGIRRRDDHLRSGDFFDVARHREATFVSSAVRREGERYAVTGRLTIRGVTRPVTLPVTLTLKANTIHIAGQLTVNRREFGIDYQSFLNPIRDEVRVWFELELTATSD